MSNTSKLMRYQIGDYLGIPDGETVTFQFMGKGFTKLDESIGAKTDSVTYVNDRTASSSIVGYESQFPFEAHLIKNEVGTMALYNVGRNHLTGEDAEFDYVRVDLFDPVSGSANTFKARKFRVCAEISDNAGEGGAALVVSGNLNAIGDPVQGTFNTTTKTFTADTVASE